MTKENKLAVRCRAIIIHEGKMLVVKHVQDSNFYALPGGHLELGENVKDCVKREIVEELGVQPEIGRLLYVNNYFDDRIGVQSIEFFFEVINVSNYVDINSATRSHAHEIFEIRWVGNNEDLNILPRRLADDFKEGKILSNDIRYIN